MSSVRSSDFPTAGPFVSGLEKKSETGSTATFIFRSNDRLNDRDGFLSSMRKAGVRAEVRPKSGQSIDPIFIEEGEKRIVILIKPVSGGIGETTLNASITELFPCIAWEGGFDPEASGGGVEGLWSFVSDSDPARLKCVFPSDVKAAEETIRKAPDSSKFREKMENALGVCKYLKTLPDNADRVWWGYRAKPEGVPSNHPGDVFVRFGPLGGMLGVSLKAGGEKTAEPKLNTYVNPVFNAFGDGEGVEKLRKDLHENVYSGIRGFPSCPETYDNKQRKKSSDALLALSRTDPDKYEELYDRHLEMCRKAVIGLFDGNTERVLEYVNSAVLGKSLDVPVKVVKAVRDGFEEITSNDKLGSLLTRVGKVASYPSPTSKQTWHIELTSDSAAESAVMDMSIRTNKPGHAGERKLGQFFNLAIKYNALRVLHHGKE